MNEFNIIEQHVASKTGGDVPVGIGDDGAVVRAPEGEELVLSIDVLVEGVHFTQNLSAEQLGHKALAVSLSDMAAMGAQPRWVLLTISAPSLDESWISRFMSGFNQLADQFQVNLIGGDLTSSSVLTVSTQVTGTVPAGKALLRSGANVGDAIFVTGEFGEAGLDFKPPSPAQRERVGERGIKTIQPRVNFGLALRSIATACIDVSDGLFQDLQHILKASHVGARLILGSIPVHNGLDVQYACTSGEDYELCFTVPPNKIDTIKAISEKLSTQCTQIGGIVASGFTLLDENGNEVNMDTNGYEHFAG